MRKLDEKREVLYVIRAMDVLMSSGIGLEASVHSLSQGGNGIISVTGNIAPKMCSQMQEFSLSKDKSKINLYNSIKW